MRKYKISGVPICEADGTLVGILTNRDMRFMTDFSVPISAVMTPRISWSPRWPAPPWRRPRKF